MLSFLAASTIIYGLLARFAWQNVLSPKALFRFDTIEMFCQKSGTQKLTHLSASELWEKKSHWLPFSDELLQRELAKVTEDVPIQSVELFLAAVFASWAQSPRRKNIYTDFVTIHPDFTKGEINPNIFCSEEPLMRVVQPVFIIDPQDPNIKFWTILRMFVEDPDRMELKIYVFTTTQMNDQRVYELLVQSKLVDVLREEFTDDEIRAHMKLTLKRIMVDPEDLLADVWRHYDQFVTGCWTYRHGTSVNDKMRIFLQSLPLKDPLPIMTMKRTGFRDVDIFTFADE